MPIARSTFVRFARVLLVFLLIGGIAGAVAPANIHGVTVLAGNDKGQGNGNGNSGDNGNQGDRGNGNEKDKEGKNNEDKKDGKEEKKDNDDKKDKDDKKDDRGKGNDDEVVVIVAQDATPVAAPTAAPSPTPALEPDPAGSLRVVAMGCADTPSEDADWDAACTRPVDGAWFEFTGIDGPFAEWTRDLIAGVDGVASLDELPPARYSLVQNGTDWCRAESDRVDDAGNVVIQDGQVTTVWIFNCPLDAVGP